MKTYFNVLVSQVLFLMLLIPAVDGFSQRNKTIETAKKKMPDWVNSIKKDYIIVTGSGPTIEEAQNNALLKVKESIVRAVAENVSVTSEMTTKEQMGTNVNNFFQSFDQTTQTKTAEIDFIKGIAINKAEDFWWEKVQSGNSITCYYHLLYPFSEMELRKLVMAYEKADRELTQELEEILARIEKNTVVEDMESDIQTLEKLAQRFIDHRKTKAEIGINQIRERIKSINIVPVSRSLGNIEYELKIGEQTVTTNKKPNVQNPTKCATITGIEPVGQGWNIMFDAQYCYDDPKNLIRVTHQFRSAKVSHDFYFDINEGKVEVYMHAPIIITASETDEKSVKKGTISFTLTNKFGGSFLVDRIVLNYAKGEPIILENVQRRFNGKGDHTMILELPREIDKDTYTSKKAPVVDGFIFYNVQGKQQTYKLYQHKVTTSW
ncbi:MAG TPA: hypothetical protein PK990_10450 [Salinivirgaceae bacterium]|nr:hypothetical protein [Salinivirgaceae bacterium]